MANRRFHQMQYALEPDLVFLFADITFGASGAPTMVAGKNKGIASVTRVSAGKYNIVLQDSYVDLLYVRATFLNATAPAAPGFYAVSYNVVTTSSPTIVVQFNNAGAATDPGVGEEVKLALQLKNSSAL